METLENFYVRVISPALTAVFIGIIVSIFFASFYPPIALVLIIFFLTLGLILPLLAQLFSRVPGQRLITQRADIQSQLVDGIQGMADLLAFGQGGRAHSKSHPQAGNMVQRKNKWHALTESILRLGHCSPIWVYGLSWY